MCPASAPGWRSDHRPGSRRADNYRGGANRPTVGWSSAPERRSRGGRDRRVRTQAKARAPEEGSFSASDSCSHDRVDGFILLELEILTSTVNEARRFLIPAPSALLADTQVRIPLLQQKQNPRPLPRKSRSLVQQPDHFQPLFRGRIGCYQSRRSKGLLKNKFRFCWRLFGCPARREVLPHGHPSIPFMGLEGAS